VYFAAGRSPFLCRAGYFHMTLGDPRLKLFSPAQAAWVVRDPGNSPTGGYEVLERVDEQADWCVIMAD
jgi:hypothetical protein